jgi:hypothetical protein
LVFWLSCLVESVEQFVSLRHTFAANLNGIVFFRRYGKNAACLQRFLRRFPPAFPFRLSENITHKPFTDLLRRGFTVQAFKNISHHGRRIFSCQIFDRRQIGRFTCEEVFRRQRRDILGRVLGLHRMRLFPGKINYDLVEQQIPFAHATESPAFMQAKCAGL